MLELSRVMGPGLYGLYLSMLSFYHPIQLY